MNHLGDYFHEQRIRQGLSLGQLARLVGYFNVSKGANKICRFEREGIVTEELLAALADALGIDFPTVESLIEQDRQEYLRAWEAWVAEVVPIRVVVRYMSAIYGSIKKPGDITTHAQAEAFACEYARKHHLRVCLALSRRHSVWIDEEGMVYARTEATPDKPNVPWVQFRSDRRRFLFRIEERP
jgi:transcriptional regulator with XRE-family HTH domain